jgi:3,4-dihydroxy-2-butanone 4-phosphate synthase
MFCDVFSGYICISMPGDRLHELQLPLMVPNNEEKHKTAYTVTVDYKYGMCVICPRRRADL